MLLFVLSVFLTVLSLSRRHLDMLFYVPDFPRSFTTLGIRCNSASYYILWVVLDCHLGLWSLYPLCCPIYMISTIVQLHLYAASTRITCPYISNIWALSRLGAGPGSRKGSGIAAAANCLFRDHTHCWSVSNSAFRAVFSVSKVDNERTVLYF